MTSALFHDAVGINMLFPPKYWCKIENAIFLEPKVPRRWLTPHWIGITGLLSEIIMKNAYHAMIFAYVSTFLAIFCKNAIITDDVIKWRHDVRFSPYLQKTFYPLLTIVQMWSDLDKSEVFYGNFCDFGLTIGIPIYFPPTADKNALTFLLGMQSSPFFQKRCLTK